MRTAFMRRNTGISAGRNGSYGYAIGNLANGYVESAAIPVSSGVKHTLSAWLRGQIDGAESPGEWRLRAQFYNASGANLGYHDLCYGGNLNTLTWQQQKCLVVPPTNAVTMKVQLWLVAAGGWRPDSLMLVKARPCGSGLTSEQKRRILEPWNEQRHPLTPCPTNRRPVSQRPGI